MRKSQRKRKPTAVAAEAAEGRRVVPKKGRSVGSADGPPPAEPVPTGSDEGTGMERPATGSQTGGAQSTGVLDKALGDLHQPLHPREAGSHKGHGLVQGLQDQDTRVSALELGRTPINLSVLCKYLEAYPNVHDAGLLRDGFHSGFRIGFVGDRLGSEARNLKSARVNPGILKEKIKKEVDLGRFAGPFRSPPVKNLKISPVGLIPKSDGSYRLITHLSHPDGCSVNDGISDADSSVIYTSFDAVADMIFQLGIGAKIAKEDIKSAFRLLPISPKEFWLLGIKDEDGNVYIDKFLPMGCKISCALFEKFSTFLQWLVSRLAGLNTMDHYLDDFIFAGAQKSNQCQKLADTFITVCDQLSVPLATEKSVHPCTRMVFLGFDLDSVNMTVSIPLQKIEELQFAISDLLTKKKATLKEFQSVVGKLSFFSKAVRSSRAFLRRFYDAMCGIRKAHHRLWISSGIRQDLVMWLAFLDNFNGITYIPPCEWYDSDTLQLFTDSAGSRNLGCGCFLKGEWSFFPWPTAWDKIGLLKDITFLEMVPVLLAVFLWGEKLKHRRVLLFIDNEALCCVLNKQSAKSKRLMQLVRQFVLLSMEYGIVFRARHIVSEQNYIADSISRKQWVRFRRLAPQALQEPQAIPDRFQSMIYNLNLTDC